MFTLEMLTKQAPPSAAEPEEAAVVSLPHVFTPVLAAPATLAEEKTSRVRGWVFVAAFIAFIAPVVTVVAVLETRAPSHPRVVVTTTAAETSTSTTAIETATATASATPEATSTPHAPAHRRPPSRTVPTTTASVKKEAPKCCPGETEMACAMRRSVGATCG